MPLPNIFGRYYQVESVSLGRADCANGAISTTRTTQQVRYVIENDTLAQKYYFVSCWHERGYSGTTLSAWKGL